MQPVRTVNVGIIGLGTVGGGVVKLIRRNAARYLAMQDIDLRIARACARHEERARELELAPEVFTTDWHEVTEDAEVDIVVEVIGGEHPALDIMLDAFAHGKHVVSANKALLARRMDEIARTARGNGAALRCEAAVAGGIPIVSTLEHDLVGNRILAVAGIMNGTTNYILSRMADEGLSYGEVLADAQRLGYAEADPTADVDGFDAAAKIAILASIAFGTRVSAGDVYTEGIRAIEADDISLARELGYTIKLLAGASEGPDGVNAHVYPALVENGHMLAGVSGAMNAVSVVGDGVGETMFYGAGAGAFPTASAVVGDVLALAEPIARGMQPIAEAEPYGRALPVTSQDTAETGYYVRLRADAIQAADTAIAAFAAQGVDVVRSAIRQDDDLQIALITDSHTDADLRRIIESLKDCAHILDIAQTIRVEDIRSWSDAALEN